MNLQLSRPGTDGKPVYIYALHDPTEQSQRVYVGITKNPKIRYGHHCKPSERDRTFRGKWVRGLSRRGVKPEMVVLETAAPDAWQEAEKFWISYFRYIGMSLVNTTDGGEGMWGYRLPDEKRIAWSAQRRQRPLRGDNKTGFKGVFPSGNKFGAKIHVGAKYHSVGTYRTAEEAALAYDKVARLHFSDYAMNFPLPGELSARPGVTGQIWNLPDVPIRQVGERRASSSGIRGIYWCSTTSRWAAYVRVDGRRKAVGFFKDIDEAAHTLERCNQDPDHARLLVSVDKRIGGASIPKSNRTGFRGVRKEESGRYTARVTIDGHEYHLGTFDSAEQAARAYDKRAAEAYGRNAILNFQES